MNCPKCGAGNAPGAAFCGSCGSPLGAPAPFGTCDQCGAPYVPNQKFCRRCGNRLPLTGFAAAPIAPVSAPAVAAPGPRATPGPLRRALKVVIPIAALVVSYYLNDYVSRTYGQLLARQFGPVATQVAPVLIFMAVGGLAYKIINR